MASSLLCPTPAHIPLHPFKFGSKRKVSAARPTVYHGMPRVPFLFNVRMGGDPPYICPKLCQMTWRIRAQVSREGMDGMGAGHMVDPRHDVPLMTSLAQAVSTRLLALAVAATVALGGPSMSLGAELESLEGGAFAGFGDKDPVTLNGDMIGSLGIGRDWSEADEEVHEQPGLGLGEPDWHATWRDAVGDDEAGNSLVAEKGEGWVMELAEGKGGVSSLCEEPYGLLPCSSSIGGNIFLIAAYGYLLLSAAKLISEGSELLLEVMNPGLIGGLVLPILGAFPDSLLILVSGARGTVEQAQEEVLVGVGVLAGSIVLILTVSWAGSLFAGRCDLVGPNGVAKDVTLTRPLDFSGTGVTTDEQTRWGAWLMMASTIPYAAIQVPLLDGHPAEGPEAAFIGCILAAIGFGAYCIYQVSSPWLQKKRIEEARLQFLRSRALQGVASFSLPQASGAGTANFKKGELSPSTLHQIFSYFDKDGDGKITDRELRALIIGLGIEEEGILPSEVRVQAWLKEFDIDKSGVLSEGEFVAGIQRWVKKVMGEKSSLQVERLESVVAASSPDFWAAKSQSARQVLDLLLEEGEGEGGGEEEHGGAEVIAPAEIYKKAAILMASGAALVAVFADPLVSSIGGFSKASGVSPFFVAFLVTPFASNASELVSSYLFAKKKRKRNISLTFSQVYGAVTMNNTLCLGIFLALVYVRGLTWNFSSEVTVILLTTFAMGALGGSRSTFPLWMAGPVLALYPTSLAIVAFLDNYLGWT